MANLIDKTYFSGDIHLVGIDNEGIVGTAANTELSAFIAEYEHIYLLDVLGETLYTAFIAGLAQVVPETKWINLKNKFVDKVKKTSPIADFVFFHLINSKVTQSTQTGEVIPNVQNSVSASNLNKIVEPFNRSVLAGYRIIVWIKNNLADYPEFDYTETNSSGNLEYVNAFNL